MKVHLRKVSAFSPLAPDWENMRQILKHERAPREEPTTEKYQPQSLPRNERRRATNLVRLTFRVLEDLTQDATLDTSDVNAVFASSGGDYDVIHRISSVLATEEKQISPTDFHNSVHNAPAGYWSIATGCHATSTSLSAGDETFAVGLMEAAMLCLSTTKETLLVAYDIAPPLPLRAARPIHQSFAVALLVGAEASSEDLASIELTPSDQEFFESQEITAFTNVLAEGNPIGQSLGLLHGLAHQTQVVRLPGLDLRLAF